MVVEVYTINLLFKGIDVKVSIKPVCGEEYQVLIRSRQKLDASYRKALAQYLEAEGYVTAAQLRFE